MDNQNYFASYIFVGCMFIGIGIGRAFNIEGIGALLGMGVGFVVSAVRSRK